MKAISVKQPWAYLICSGIKDIENRTWKCPEKYIGQRVLIHASGSHDKRFRIQLTDEQMIAAFPSMSKEAIDGRFDFGAIIGSVEIVDCVINHPSIWAEKSKELKAGDIVSYKNTRGNIKNAEIISFSTVDSGKIWFHGIDTQTKAEVWYPSHISLELMGNPITYNWVLANPILFDHPILNVKGKLGFWDYELNEERL